MPIERKLFEFELFLQESRIVNALCDTCALPLIEISIIWDNFSVKKQQVKKHIYNMYICICVYVLIDNMYFM